MSVSNRSRPQDESRPPEAGGPADERSGDRPSVDDLRKEAVLRFAGAVVSVAIGAHLLVAGLGGIVGLDLLAALYLPFGAIGIVLGAGLFVEAGIRAVRVGISRGPVGSRRRREDEQRRGNAGQHDRRTREGNRRRQGQQRRRSDG